MAFLLFHKKANSTYQKIMKKLNIVEFLSIGRYFYKKFKITINAI